MLKSSGKLFIIIPENVFGLELTTHQIVCIV
jgi:hypothetical protein